MFIDEIKRQLKNIIINDLEEGFKSLKELIHKSGNRYNDIILLENRLALIKDDFRKGLIIQDSYRVESSKITESLISVIDKISMKDLDHEKDNTHSGDGGLSFLNSKRIYILEQEAISLQRSIIELKDITQSFVVDLKESQTQNREVLKLLTNKIEQENFFNNKSRESLFSILSKKHIILLYGIQLLISTILGFFWLKEEQFGFNWMSFVILTLSIVFILSLVSSRLKYFDYKNPWWVAGLKDWLLFLIFGLIHLIISTISISFLASSNGSFMDDIKINGILTLLFVIIIYVIFGFVVSLIANLISTVYNVKK